MIDWVSGSFLLPRGMGVVPGFDTGATVYLKPGRYVERIVPAWLPVKGSFDDGMRVKVVGDLFRFEGNPVKFLTGQNVVGPDDLVGLVSAVVPILLDAIGLSPHAVLLMFGCRLSRVDITYSFDLGAVERVREYLRVARSTGSARMQGRATSAGNTVYFGQRSRRHSVKFYGKGDEVKRHPVSLGLPADVCGAIAAITPGLLRVELTLRGLELDERGLVFACAWRDGLVCLREWVKDVSKISVSGGVDLLPDELLALPSWLRATYDRWATGGDMSQLLSNGTYYRHKSALLLATDGRVDISLLRPVVKAQPLAATDVTHWLRGLRPFNLQDADGQAADILRGHLARFGMVDGIRRAS